jgi:uncharacterized cupredoxin-like copper-binding protein
VAAVAAFALITPACGCEASADTVERTILIHYSAFEPGVVEVPAGAPVTITLENDDPIDHEWIIGDADVHERHRTGTEPFHAEVPTEVTVPALSTRATTLTFAGPGDFQFICHLPGHEQYGMVGIVRAVEAE